MKNLSLVENLQGLSFKIHKDTQRCKCCASLYKEKTHPHGSVIKFMSH